MPHRPVATTAICILTVCLAGRPVLRGGDLPACNSAASRGCHETCSRCGPWYVVETDNFLAYCLDSQSTADQLATTAELLRAKLRSKWLSDDSQDSWAPKCQLVLHPNLASYTSACGLGSEHTVGSSLVKAEHGHIAARRIDLLGGRSDFLSAALPHELTHIVWKDRFPSLAVPRWADEGAAILADTNAKQRRHRRDLDTAIAHNATFDVATLLTLDDYPHPDRVGTFYGQSVSLVEFLVEQKQPAKFIEFIERATAIGNDAALRECYGIADVRELDRRWRRSLSATMVASSKLPAARANVQ